MTQVAHHQKFLGLLEEHKRMLYKVANSYCRNPADLQDLAQEIVAQLWRSFDRYDDRFRFSTWMYRIALNVAISYHRGESRRARHTVAATEELLEIPAETAGGPEKDETLELLHRYIRGLGEMDRALMLLYLDGNRHDTIAEILGISETNVATKIGRIKQRLRGEFETAARPESHKERTS